MKCMMPDAESLVYAWQPCIRDREQPISPISAMDPPPAKAGREADVSMEDRHPRPRPRESCCPVAVAAADRRK